MLSWSVSTRPFHQPRIDYILQLIDEATPYLMEIVYEPETLDNMTISMHNDPDGGATAWCDKSLISMHPLRISSGYDDDRDGLIDEDPFDSVDNDLDGRVDEDGLTNPAWDEVFIHELCHLFQLSDACFVPRPSWFAEGLVEAGTYYVGKQMTEEGIRRFDTAGFPRNVANSDFNGNAGPLVLGGFERLSHRVDWRIAYAAAASAFIIPAAAEIDAGRDRPHPLKRLMLSLRDEIERPGPHDFMAAVDRAWVTPIDGIFPPSRWIRSRSITTPDVREGSFLGILSRRADSGLDPAGLWLLSFDRDNVFENTQRVPTSGLTYAGTGMQYVDEPQNRAFPAVPDLPAGAYRVEAAQEGEDGNFLTAKNWILITGEEGRHPADWEGAAIVLVDRMGVPIDPADLSVNGRILRRVPGGIIVSPNTIGEPITVSVGGKVRGTLTMPEGLPRFKVLHVEDSLLCNLVSWNPYHPRAGEPLTVLFRPGESALDPGIKNVVMQLLETGTQQELASSPMIPSDRPGVLAGTITIPEHIESAYLSFQGGDGVHVSWTDPHSNIYDYGFDFLRESQAELLSVRMTGSKIHLRFSTPPDPQSLTLRYATSRDGPWIDLKNGAEVDTDDPMSVWWSMPKGEDDRYFVRIFRSGRGGMNSWSPRSGVLSAAHPISGCWRRCRTRAVVTYPFVLARKKSSMRESRYSTWPVKGSMVRSRYCCDPEPRRSPGTGVPFQETPVQVYISCGCPLNRWI